MNTTNSTNINYWKKKKNDDVGNIILFLCAGIFYDV